MLMLGYKNSKHIFATLALRTFAPSEPTRFGSAMKIYKYIFAALTSLTFHVEHFECSNKKCILKV